MLYIFHFLTLFFVAFAMTQMFIVLLASEREIVNLTFGGKQTLRYLR